MFLKFRKSHRKLPVLEFLFNKVICLKDCIFVKKRLQHLCFPLTFAKFLRTPFLQNTSGGCFWVSYRNLLCYFKKDFNFSILKTPTMNFEKMLKILLHFIFFSFGLNNFSFFFRTPSSTWHIKKEELKQTSRDVQEIAALKVQEIVKHSCLKSLENFEKLL